MWKPGWQEIPTDEQRHNMEAICAGERWILDTAYGKWLDIVMARVDLIVALDYPRWVSLGRLLRRSFMRVVFRRRVCNGNIETLRTSLAHDSIIIWHFRSFARKQARIRDWAADVSGPAVVRLTSDDAPSVGSKTLVAVQGTNALSDTKFARSLPSKASAKRDGVAWVEMHALSALVSPGASGAHELSV
jgi:adenylate kinase family enzyme